MHAYDDDDEVEINPQKADEIVWYSAQIFFPLRLKHIAAPSHNFLRINICHHGKSASIDLSVLFALQSPAEKRWDVFSWKKKWIMR